MFLLLAPPALHQDLPSEAYLKKERDTWLNIAQNSKSDVEAWHKTAEFEGQMGNWDKAIQYESKAIEGHAKYAVAYAGRGRAQFEKKNWAACRADCSKAIELMEARGGLQKYLDFEKPPDFYIEAYRRRGLAWSWEAKWDEALRDFDITLKLDKDNAKLHFERGYLAEKAKRADASKFYLRAGLLYWDGHNRAKANECLEALKRVGAKNEAAQLQKKMEGGAVKSDLPG